MASPNHAWWEGMYLVGRNFYSRFLPQVRELAGREKGDAIIARHLQDVGGHAWLAQPQRSSPILGYRPAPPVAAAPTAEPAPVGGAQ
jgi:hypothetical protein